MKEHKQVNPEEHIQSFQTDEAWTPCYIAKQSPTADPKLNHEPATNLNERILAGTVHGHAPIRSRSLNPRTNSGPSRGENTFSDGRTPWSA